MNDQLSRETAASSIEELVDRDPAKDLEITTAKLARIEAQGREEYYSLRREWSSQIIFWITVLISFNMLISLLVGGNILNYKEYQWFIIAVTVETFLQVVGMGYIAVRYLFSEPDPRQNSK